MNAHLKNRPVDFQDLMPMLRLLLVALALLLSVMLLYVAAGPADEAGAVFEEALGGVPLFFELNAGQAEPAVRYLSRGPGFTLYLTNEGSALSLSTGQAEARSEAIDLRTVTMHLVRANRDAEFRGVNQLSGQVNYLVGDDPTQWRTGITTFRGVEYVGVYPGIDMVFHGTNDVLEYDFKVAPGADPTQIGLTIAGHDGISLDEQGNLLISIGKETVVMNRPVAFQRVDGETQAVEAAFEITRDGIIGFRLGAYDANQQLIIDPVLDFATYYGGSNDDTVSGLEVDAAGFIYFGGRTYSPNLPTTPGAFRTYLLGSVDSFIVKMTPNGSELVYATYLGGSSGECASGCPMTTDGSGHVYVAGNTRSIDFPTTPNAFDRTNDGGEFGDGFVAKLSADGASLEYGTFLGGSGGEEILDIVVDGQGNAHVVGWTSSSTYPTTSGAYDTSYNGNRDTMITKLNEDGSGLLFSTFFGGSQMDANTYDIAVDGNGYVYAGGWITYDGWPTTPGAFDTTFDGPPSMPPGAPGDAMLLKLTPDGSNLVYSTFLGHTGNDSINEIVPSDNGTVTVVGWTNSVDFPVTPGAYDQTANGAGDAFITRFTADGSALIFSSFLGGTDEDWGVALTFAPGGNLVVVGSSKSVDFPTTGDALFPDNNGGYDGFVAILDNAAAQLRYGTYFGGSADDHAGNVRVNPDRGVVLNGYTLSGDLPTTPNAFDTSYNGSRDVFVAGLWGEPTDVGLSNFGKITSSSSTTVLIATAVFLGLVLLSARHGMEPGRNRE